MAKKSFNPKKLNPDSATISASTWNAFAHDYEQRNRRTSLSYSPLNRPLPPVLQNSSIAMASLKDGQDPISAYQPVRITKLVAGNDLAFSLPMYEVEAVDAVDSNGDPTDRHGNYAFTLAEGLSADGGGRIVISGLAIVAVTREEAFGLEDYNDAYGNPYPAYDGDYDSAFYVVDDGTILDDGTPVRLAPVGHFKVMSWYDPAQITDGKSLSNDPVFFVVDMNQRFTSTMMEIFATVAGFQGENAATTMNFGYGYVDVPDTGTLADIADNPRIGNNSFAGAATPGNEPSVLTGEAKLRCKVTNPHLYDAGAGRSYTVAYSRSMNRLIFADLRPHGDGRVHAWYYSFDPDEMLSRGRSSGFYMGAGWGNWDDDTTDSVPVPTYLYTSEDRFAEGTVMLSSDYMTAGGNTSPTFKNQSVPSQPADDISCAIVLMMDANHEYATYCSEKCPEEGVLMSADYGEFRIS